MKGHVLLSSLYEKKTADGLFVPFSTHAEYIMNADGESAAMKGSVYRMAVPESIQRPLGYVHAIERAITRAVIPEIYPVTGFGGYGIDENGCFYADYYDEGSGVFNLTAGDGGTPDFTRSARILFKMTPEGRVSACVTGRYGETSAYKVRTKTEKGKDTHSPSAAFYFILSYLLARRGLLSSQGAVVPKGTGADAALCHYDGIIGGYTCLDMQSFGENMRALDADLYTFVRFYGDVDGETRKSFIPDAALLDMPEFPLWDPAAEPPGRMVVEGGCSPVLGSPGRGCTEGGMDGSGLTVGELAATGRYTLGKSLSPAQEELVPKGMDGFYPEPEIVDIAMEVKKSSCQPRPARNFLITGETGTGKSAGAAMAAVLLHLPYYSMTLSGDKLSGDLTLTCLPNPHKTDPAEVVKRLCSWPDAEATMMDPAAAYERITGRTRPGATERDVNTAKGMVLANMVNRMSDFVYVESPFVRAFRSGGVIELQEANACRPEILKALNEALDDLNVLHLQTGEIVHRDRDCVVIATANVGEGYTGVKPFSNDFLSRFDQADVLEVPDDDTMVRRVTLRTGYDNVNVIRKMLSVMRSIKTVLETCEGSSGACSPRSVYAWARKTKNTGDPYRAALPTIVGLSTQNPEVRVEVIHALETQFAPKR